MILDPVFLCVSPGSGASLFFPREQIIAELARTVELRRDIYPKRVARGRMSRLEMDREIELMTTLWLDLAADQAGDADRRLQRDAADRRLNTFTWPELVAGLREEIIHRRAHYPALVDAGTITADQARRQLGAMEAAHLLYWRIGRAFWPQELGPRRPGLSGPAEQQIFMQAFRTHRQRFDLRMDALHGEYAQAPAGAATPPAAAPAETFSQAALAL